MRWLISLALLLPPGQLHGVRVEGAAPVRWGLSSRNKRLEVRWGFFEGFGVDFPKKLFLNP